MSSQDIFIIEPSTVEEANALRAFAKALKLKFMVSEKVYNPDFVSKIKQSEKEIAEGKGKAVKKDDLKQFLGI